MAAMAKTFRRIVAVYTVLIALFACWQFIDIYRDAWSPEMLNERGMPVERVYTPEKLSGRLGSILKLSAGYPALIIAALVFGKRTGIKEEAVSPEPEYLLMRAKKRGGTAGEDARREINVRKRIRMAGGAVILLSSAGCLVYLLDKNNFASWDLEPVMGSMLRHVLPWLAAAFIAAGACSHLEGKSAAREMKALVKGEGEPGGQTREPAQDRAAIAGWVLLAAAIAFIVIGVTKGDPASVMTKAIRICTECIGLG